MKDFILRLFRKIFYTSPDSSQFVNLSNKLQQVKRRPRDYLLQDSPSLDRDDLSPFPIANCSVVRVGEETSELNSPSATVGLASIKKADEKIATIEV